MTDGTTIWHIQVWLLTIFLGLLLLSLKSNNKDFLERLVIDLALCVASIRKVEQGRGCHHYKNTVSCEKAKEKKLCE